MVEALDHDAQVIITPIEGTKTSRLACSDCDWMETAGSASVATRKKNQHVAEHRAATQGAEGVPTIMDAIEGRAEIPEGSFRESVPVTGPELCDFVNDEGVRCRLLAGHMDLKGHRFPEEIKEEDVVVEDVPDRTRDLEGEPIPVGQVLKESFHLPRVEDVREAELDAPEPRPHTRTTTTAGPDFCAECSAELDDWVPWPCQEIAERGRLAVALTRSRLEDQRGPSDFDKDLEDSEWHRVRAESVSATLAAKLGSAADVDFLVAREVRERLGGSRFRGNSYTRWGRDREPFLEKAGQARHGIEPETCLFFSRANPRHVASPDGIAIHPEHGEVALGEYKTSGKELTWAKMVANGYYDQVQWQLYVLEASHCWLMWEWRHGEGLDYSTYVPQIGGEHLILRDETRITELVSRADRFLEALDAARARIQDDVEIDPQLYWLVDQHLQAKAEARVAEEQLREYCEANGVKSVEIDGVAKVSYSWGSPRMTFDRERFDADYPGVYETYKVAGAPPERPTLRVTPAKGDDDQ